jgi:queuine tRNA-ribosyltransferase
MGYNLFDCALPTRDARRGRLYVFRSDGGLEYGRLYIRDAAHRRDGKPVSDACDCLTCRGHSRAYLHHLFAVGDALAWRLATIHNLRFYAALLERLNKRGGAGG